MKIAGAVLLLVVGAPAMAQDAPAWTGTADCRLAAVKPPPASSPSWNGGCKAGYAEGKGVLEWDDAKDKHYRMEAEFAAGRVRGEVTLRYPDGVVYKGPLTNGVPDGVGYFRFADGDQYEGDVRMDELTGTGEVLYKNGDDYKGGFKKGKRDGVGVLTWVLGGRYEGGWKDGNPSGPGKIVYAGGTGREVAVQDGRAPGQTDAVAVTGGGYSVKRDFATPGSTYRADAATGIPVRPDKGFRDLSPQEQAMVKSWYVGLAPGDEPPYPANGPADFYKAMARILHETLVEGDVSVYVLVGPDGKARNVTALGLEDAAARKAVAAVAAVIPYKPAVCAGQPCEMVYPYRLGFSLKP
jgi:hypothetical protein